MSTWREQSCRSLDNSREQPKKPPREFVCVLTFPSPTLSAFVRTPLLIASMRRRPPTRRLLNANYIIPYRFRHV